MVPRRLDIRGRGGVHSESVDLLDVRTLVALQAAFFVVCALVVTILWRQHRARYAGLGFWVADYWLQALTPVLIALRGRIPDWASIVLANLLGMSGTLLLLVGLERFFNRRGPQAHNVALLGLFGAAHAWFTFAQPSLQARNVNVSLALLLLCAQCAWLLLRRIDRGQRRIAAGAGAVFLAFSLVSAVRIVVTLAGARPESDFFLSGAFQALVLLVYQMLFVLLTFSLVLLVNGRLLAEVRAGEEKFEKVFQSAPYAVLLTRPPEHRIAEVNEAFQRISGYRRDEVVGKTTLELRLWEREEDRAALIAAVAASGSVREVEHRFRGRSGDTVIGLISVETVRIDGAPWLLSSISDITQRRRTEEDLRETARQIALEAAIGAAVTRMEELPQILEECAGIVVQELGAALARIWVIDESRDVLQLQASAGRNPRPGTDDSRIPVGTQTVGRIAAERSPHLTNALIGDPQFDDQAWAAREGLTAFAGYPLIAEGSVVGVLAAFARAPLTPFALDALRTAADQIALGIAHKQTEAQLRLSRQRMALHLEHTPLGVIEWNPDATVREWNPAAERIFGHPRAEALGRHASFLVPPAARERVAADWAILLGEKTASRSASENLTRSGALISCEWFNTPLVDAAGAVIGVASLVHDVSERDAYERQLREKSAEMERFTYTISHDLKSPLVTVRTFLGYLEQDLERQDAAAVRGDLRYMRTAAEKMARMLEELLELSRLGRVANTPASVTFRELVDEALALVAGRIAQRGVAVQVADAPLGLVGDRARLVEIWQNLIDNAVKFMGEQPAPRVEIGFEGRGAGTVFFVRDNGIGVAPAAAENIFGLFDKLDPGSEGTGLGLAVVKKIVELYGGRVWVEPAAGGAGASFRFTLPSALPPGES